jgi:chromosome segregation ATPase
MTDDMTTRPTIETVLERIGAFDEKVDKRINTLEQKIDDRISVLERKIDALEKKVDERFDQVNGRFSLVDTEIDRLASVAYSTKSEMHSLRLVVREIQAQLKQALPVLQES